MEVPPEEADPWVAIAARTECVAIVGSSGVRIASAPNPSISKEVK